MAYYIVPTTESAKILRGTAETISVTFYSAETAGDADGSVTVGMVDAAGNTIVAAGTATSAAGSGVYNYSLTAQTNLNEITATWTGTFGGNAMEFTTQHSIVGGFYCTPSEVRAMTSISGEASTFPTSDIVRSINQAEQIIEDYCGVSFVYRYHRDVFDGNNTTELPLTHMFPQVIISGSIGGTALTATQISNLNKYKSGVIRLKSDVWAFNNPGGQVIVNYEAGVNKTPPEPISFVAKSLARYTMLELVSRVPDKSTSLSTEFGNIQIAQPGMNRPTGIPDLDTILNRYRYRAPTAF